MEPLIEWGPKARDIEDGTMNPIKMDNEVTMLVFVKLLLIFIWLECRILRIAQAQTKMKKLIPYDSFLLIRIVPRRIGLQILCRLVSWSFGAYFRILIGKPQTRKSILDTLLHDSKVGILYKLQGFSCNFPGKCKFYLRKLFKLPKNKEYLNLPVRSCFLVRTVRN